MSGTSMVGIITAVPRQRMKCWKPSTIAPPAPYKKQTDSVPERHNHTTQLGERIVQVLPQDGLESMQYSIPISWSMGGWLISSGFMPVISMGGSSPALPEMTRGKQLQDLFHRAV